MSTGKWREKATHCKYGHEYSTENTRIDIQPNGRSVRLCIACKIRRSREYNAMAHRDPIVEANARILAYNAWLAGRPDDYVDLEHVE